jgi:hypothetical protein
MGGALGQGTSFIKPDGGLDVADRLQFGLLLLLIFGFSSFLIFVFKFISFSVYTVLAVTYKLSCVIFSLLISSKYF